MGESGFWDDNQKAQGIMKELNTLKASIKEYELIQNKYDDAQTLIEIAYEENDPSLIPEIEESLDDFIKEFEGLKLKTLCREDMIAIMQF